jgi:hypothetical protein
LKSSMAWEVLGPVGSARISLMRTVEICAWAG